MSKEDVIGLVLLVCAVVTVVAGLTFAAVYEDKQRGETLRACLSAGREPDACGRLQ